MHVMLRAKGAGMLQSEAKKTLNCLQVRNVKTQEDSCTFTNFNILHVSSHFILKSNLNLMAQTKGFLYD